MTAHEAMPQRAAELGDLDVQRPLVEAGVVSWRWSRGLSGWDDPAPFASERFGERRGQLRKNRPAGRFQDQDLIGLDEQGRPVVVRGHDGSGKPFAETLIRSEDERVEAARFQLRAPVWGPPFLMRLLWLELDAKGRPRELFNFHPESGGHGQHERYVLDEEDRITRVHMERPPTEDVPTWAAELRPVYDGAGVLVALDELPIRPLAGRARVWRTPPDRSKLAAWKDTVLVELPGAVLAAVERAGIGHPAVIALVYDEEDLLLEVSALDAVGLATHVEDAYDGQLLSPPDWVGNITLALEPSAGLAAALGELRLEQVATPRLGRQLMIQVAVTLNGMTWPGAPHAERFAFATDVHGDRAEANLKKVLGNEHVRRLRRQRWV